MELIKKTRSLCPQCLEEIEASVFEKEGGVWMQKNCKEHGEFWGFVEKDVEFYKAMMNEKGEMCPAQFIVVPITHRCNLNCNFCFVPNRGREDEPIDEIKRKIKKIISGNRVLSICLSGGEPTLREDLIEIIEFIKGNYPSIYITLLTNGVKLSDLDYVKKLKDAGLDRINFSFNGFSDEIYRKINGANLFEIKKRALENIKKEGIITALSPTLIKGVNEGDLKNIFDFALDNLDFINEVRIRGVAKVGKYTEEESFTTSEMLELVSNSLGVNKEYFLKNFSRRDCYHSAYSFHACLFISKNNDEKRIIGWTYAEKRGKPSVDNLIKAIKRLVDIFLSKETKEVIGALFNSGILIPTANKCLRDKKILTFLKMLNVYTLKINIWYWADKNNIDLGEIRAWGMKHVMADGRILNFSEATVMAEEL